MDGIGKSHSTTGLQLVDQRIERQNQGDGQQRDSAARASASRSVFAGSDVSRIAMINGGIKMMSWPATTLGQRRGSIPGATRYCIKNQDEVRIKAKHKSRLAAGRRRLAIAEQVPKP